MICVFRPSRCQYELYPAAISEALPNFRVPLRDYDADVVIQLQVALDACYEAGRYGNDIDYAKSPMPEYNEAEDAWAQDNLNA